MEAKASLNNLRVSPRKARLLADLVRGKQVQFAIDALKFTNKAASEPMRKLIESAVANAENNHGLDVDILYVKELQVNGGQMLKRFMPRAQGRAYTVRKRTSHISVVLAEK